MIHRSSDPTWQTDPNLTHRARGLLAWLLTGDTRVASRDLAATSLEGRTAILTALKELEGAGYIKRRMERRGGRLCPEADVFDRRS